MLAPCDLQSRRRSLDLGMGDRRKEGSLALGVYRAKRLDISISILSLACTYFTLHQTIQPSFDSHGRKYSVETP
ncbi:unnamed protein product [Allacma fusca]|uniref:Uncharacterized protein n=1 Tax=Allacma fusca TaxID=39272 RepID=A0A8J2KS12_9HEXA|nr:unnamed protein product [Allacma fusca]